MFNPKESILDKHLATSGIENQILGTIADVFTGGGYSRNKQAKAAAKRQNKYNKEVYEFQYGDVDDDKLGGEALRQYEFNVERLEINKRNNEANLLFKENQSVQDYNYQMGIRAYEYNQQVRAYDQSVARATRQQEFNEVATKAAFADQARLYHEQLIDLSLDETETLFNYGMAAAGVGVKQRKARAEAATTAQRDRVAALKAQGQLASRGQAGRSASRAIQGIVAESGARQAAIVDQLMFSTETNQNELFRLNGQIVMDQVGFEFSRESAKMGDMAARTKIKAQALQAAINAEASIRLKPEIAPPLPKPLALPRPEYQDVYKPKKPPQAMKAVAPQENLFAAGISTVGGFVASGLTGQGIGTPGGFRGFNWGKAVGGIF